MNSKYLIGLLLIVLASCSSPLTKEQKEADAVYLKQVKEYTLNADGSYAYHYYHKLLYNTYNSINRFYGETFVVYNPAYQTLKVNKSETTMNDGKLFCSPQNAYNEVLPSSAADAPAYNNLREMVITHVGLERGSVVELDYEIQTKAGFVPFLSDKVCLSESSPVKELEVIVRVPKGEKLNYNILNQPAGLSIKMTTKGEFDVYSWKSYNLNATNHESLQSEGLTAYPTLLFSTKDLTSAFEYIKTNLAQNFTPDEYALKLQKSDLKGWDKVELIRSYVASSINTYGVSPIVTGYRFRSPNDVWKSNGGTEGEKAILLSLMLKNAGFNANVAVAGYPVFFSIEVGNLSSFDKFLVKVECAGEVKYISAIEEHSKVPGQRFPVAISDDIAKADLAKQPKQQLKYSLNANLTISTDGKVSGKVDILLNNLDETKGILSGISSSDYSKTKSLVEKGSYSYTMDFNSSYHAEKVDGLYILTLLSIAQGYESLGAGELPFGRITDIDLPGIINEEYVFSFSLPKGYSMISPVNQTSIENGVGTCTIVQTLKDDKIIITRKLNINQANIPVKEYDAFRKIVSLWSDKNLNRVVIKAE